MKTRYLALIASILLTVSALAPAALADNAETGVLDFSQTAGDDSNISDIMGETVSDSAAYTGDNQDYILMDTLDQASVITEPGTYYLTGNGITISGNGITVDTDGQVTIILDNVMIEADAAFIIVRGQVDLVLLDDNYISSTGYYAGIQNGENPLTITSGDGDGETYGSLNVIGGGGAGIGGSYSEDGSTNGSNITINGGTITAVGGTMSAGIGGAYFGNGENIAINGGAVYASGSEGASGIGGGGYGNGSTITISGGTVIASGGKKAAGIGGGMGGGGGDAVTVTGGTVTALGGELGAGIGGGQEGNGTAIALSGGIVRAIGGQYAAGAGGGDQGNGENITVSKTDKSIIVSGGQFTEVNVGGGYGGSTSNCAGSEGRLVQIFGGDIWGYVIIAVAALLVGGWGMVLLARPGKKENEDSAEIESKNEK